MLANNYFFSLTTIRLIPTSPGFCMSNEQILNASRHFSICTLILANINFSTQTNIWLSRTSPCFCVSDKYVQDSDRFIPVLSSILAKKKIIPPIVPQDNFGLLPDNLAQTDRFRMQHDFFQFALNFWGLILFSPGLLSDLFGLVPDSVFQIYIFSCQPDLFPFAL